MQAALVMDDLSDRLTQEALRILGGISVRWEIDDDVAARIAGVSVMGYLRRRNGYDERPFPRDVIHRITALGLIDRAVCASGEDPASWVETTNDDEPFMGGRPIEVLPELDMEALTALNVRMSARRGRPVEVVIPRM